MGDTRTPEQKQLAEERKAQVIAWRRDGVPFEEIGRRLQPEDPLSRQRAHAIYAEALKQIPAMEVQQYRDEQAERLDELLREARAVLQNRHVAVSQGRVVREGEPYIDSETGRAAVEDGFGAPVLDDAPKLHAMRTILQIEERRAKLLGLDTPVTQRVEGDLNVKYVVEGVDVEGLT